MTAGRTSPALLACRNDTEGENEFVVKFRASVSNGIAGLASELLVSHLADHFGLPTPAPAIVRLSEQLARLVAEREPVKADLLLGSVGLNFGSSHLKGVFPWPIAKDLPESMRRAAAEVFAFDALIQNDDRRRENQNLFTRGDEFILFDHEMAFSFLYAIFPDREPWNVDKRQDLERHVFYSALRKRPVDLSRFTARLAALDDDMLRGLIAELPGDWWNDNLGRISDHLKAMREHAQAFEQQLTRRLAR